MTAPDSVVIIGAGPAGLTAAYALSKDGCAGRDAPVLPRRAIETAAAALREEGGS